MAELRRYAAELPGCAAFAGLAELQPSASSSTLDPVTGGGCGVGLDDPSAYSSWLGAPSSGVQGGACAGEENSWRPLQGRNGGERGGAFPLSEEEEVASEARLWRVLPTFSVEVRSAADDLPRKMSAEMHSPAIAAREVSRFDMAGRPRGRGARRACRGGRSAAEPSRVSPGAGAAHARRFYRPRAGRGLGRVQSGGTSDFCGGDDGKGFFGFCGGGSGSVW